MAVTLDTILAAQKKAYELKKEVAHAELLEQKIRDNAAKDIRMAEANVEKTKAKLVETLQYLQDHNSGKNGPHADWFKEFGIELEKPEPEVSVSPEPNVVSEEPAETVEV